MANNRTAIVSKAALGAHQFELVSSMADEVESIPAGGDIVLVAVSPQGLGDEVTVESDRPVPVALRAAAERLLWVAEQLERIERLPLGASVDVTAVAS